MLLDQLDAMLEICQAGCFDAVVGRGYEIVNSEFIFAEEGVDVCLI